MFRDYDIYKTRQALVIKRTTIVRPGLCTMPKEFLPREAHKERIARIDTRHRIKSLSEKVMIKNRFNKISHPADIKYRQYVQKS